MPISLHSSTLLLPAYFNHPPPLKSPSYQNACPSVVSYFNGKRCNPRGVAGVSLFKNATNEPVFEDKTLRFAFEEEVPVEIEDEGSPWEGAVVYKRNASITHVEYCTTLERLGLGSLSTDVSKAKASSMGLRITEAVNDYPSGTPVQVSIDVTRKVQKIRLDGIVKTGINPWL